MEWYREYGVTLERLRTFYRNREKVITFVFDEYEEARSFCYAFTVFGTLFPEACVELFKVGDVQACVDGGEFIVQIQRTVAAKE